MESSLIEKAVKKRLEKWDKKNPAPNVDDKDAHTKWLQDRSEAEEKFRDSYKRNSEKKENKKEKEGELNEAQILKLTTELRRKSQISADYAAAIEGYRSQPPTRENKMEIAKYQFAKQAIDQEIERINQLLTREVEKAPWMKKLRLMAIIAGAAVVYILNHGREGCGFSAARNACHKYQPPLFHCQFLKDLGKIQFNKALDYHGDYP